MPERLRVGARASVEHTFSADDIAAFAALSADDNPIHLDPRAAADAGFDAPIVHGVLVLGLISRVLGTELPGPGTVLLEQHLRYRRPVYPGQAVRAVVEVTSVREDKPIYGLRTWVEAEEIVVEGDATVLVRELRSRP
jgi:acyl dehydratase